MQKIEDIKKEIIKKLEAEELNSHEQDELIAVMTDALLERATLELMSKLPESALVELNGNKEVNEDPDEMLKYFEKYISNVDEIIQKAFKEGLDAYKEDLNN